MPFIPLHIHSEYSLLDGCIRCKDLIKYCKDNNITSIAVTDHGNISCSVEFYYKLRAEGIKLIVGCEFYLYHGSFEQMKENKDRKAFHIVLLAKNQEGYKNLIKLHNIAHRDGFYYKSRINLEALKKHSEGLICLSACLGGDIQQALLQENIPLAEERIQFYQKLFGDDFYLEFQDHGIPEQQKVNPILVELCKKYNLKPVVTTDAHYPLESDSETHSVLLCVNTGRTYDDPNRFKFNFKPYLQTETEIRETFNWMSPDLLDNSILNTELIAEQCNVDFEFGNYMIPDFNIPEGFENQDSYLKHLATKGLHKRYPDITQDLIDRLEYELSVIAQMGFAGYFLIIADIVNWAKEANIPVGVGRGSAGGSVVTYCLGITDIDPIKHNLYFERFLNPDRVSMPDIDIDFAPESREKVIAYIKSKYGEDHVCQIVTFGTLATKASIKAVARVFKLPFAESNDLTDAIPDDAKSVDQAISGSKKIQDLYEKNKLVKKVLDFAKDLEGLKCNTGVHASGIVISKYPLDECMPLIHTKDKGLATAYAMKQVDALGFLKLDVLGLRNLTVIDNTVNMVKNNKGVDINIKEIPYDNEATYALLSKGYSAGVFQLESDGMVSLLKRLKPSVFSDIDAVVALFRPGPLNSGMVDQFVANKKLNREDITYEHPLLKPVLEDTYGCMVYQEQIMRIARDLANYSMSEADSLRKAMGKKKPEEMALHKDKFINGAIKNGIENELAESLFSKMSNFAEYGFNKAHSCAYAMLAYQTAYLKANYPIEYMTALLNSVKDKNDYLKSYLDDCYKLGIKLLPPDVNEAGADFVCTSEGIRFGLGAINGLGATANKIIKERKKGKFESFIDFCCRCDFTNKTHLENLCKVNAFKSVENNSKRCLITLEAILKAKEKKDQARFKKGEKKNYADHDFTFKEIINYFIKDMDLNLNTIDFNVLENEKNERDLLGFYVSSHPLIRISHIKDKLVSHTIEDVLNLQANINCEEWIEKDQKFTYKHQVKIIGIIKKAKVHVTKSGQTMAFITIEDFDNAVDVTVFSGVYKENKIQEGNLVIIKGHPQSQPDNNFSPYTIIADYVGVVDYYKEIYLDVTNKSLDQLSLLKGELLNNIGYNPVILIYKDNKILTDKRYWTKDASIPI